VFVKVIYLTLLFECLLLLLQYSLSLVQVSVTVRLLILTCLGLYLSGISLLLAVCLITRVPRCTNVTLLVCVRLLPR